MEFADLFTLLESNQQDVVDEIKQKIHEIFSTTKDSWLLNGLYDYYLLSNSFRAIEILVSVHEPNDKYLMDKLCDTMKGPTKMQSLNLFGHLLRRQPTWIYKITQHQLMKDLLKLLKVESDILPLMSALLSVIILLPMIPSSIGPYLDDIFQIFSRLAAWNSNNSGKINEDHLIHLQVALYALFVRLYGMYPCNFITYLRNLYRYRDHASIFVHTIKPMLDTVRMHPHLVIAPKDYETTTSRWKRFEQHDIIVECEKLTLDMTNATTTTAISARDEPLSCNEAFVNCRPKSSNDHPLKFDPTVSNQLHQTIRNNAFLNIDADEKEFWTPNQFFELSSSPTLESTAPTSIPQTPIPQINMSSHNLLNSLYAQTEGTSPPEAAIEATPDTTIIKDLRQLPTKTLTNSTAVRALNPLKWASGQSIASNNSQPTSPMRLTDSVLSPFRFPVDSNVFDFPRKDYSSAFTERRESQYHKLSRIMQDRCHSVTIDHDRSSRTKTPSFQPTSPLRIISASETSIVNTASIPNSPIPIDAVSVHRNHEHHLTLAHPKAEKTNFQLVDTSNSTVENLDSSQEDQEVLEIVRQGELQKDLTERSVTQQCDSVIQDIQSNHDDDFEECCEQEKNSPCTSGGLHMPNSRSMLDFARRVNRLRFYSQCGPDNTPNEALGVSVGSPVNADGCIISTNFRRSKSCPEIKKGPAASSASSQVTVVQDSTKETTSKVLSTEETTKVSKEKKKLLFKRAISMVSTETQTDDFRPMPYEHLFLSVFPSLNTSNNSNSTASPPPQELNNNRSPMRFSPYDILDKYIENAAGYYERKLTTSANPNTDQDLRFLRDQLGLVHLQLQFERHRREIHAVRNRRLLGESRSNRALEEHIAALRDQLLLMQRENENLQQQLDDKRVDFATFKKDFQDASTLWKNQFKQISGENIALKEQNQIMQRDLNEKNDKIQQLTRDFNEVQSALYHKEIELKTAQEQVLIADEMKSQLQHLQKELVLMGEVQLRYQDQLNQLQKLKTNSPEFQLMSETYYNEIKNLNAQLESKTLALEACKAHMIELENTISQQHNLCAIQKDLLKKSEQEFQAKLQAVENKYESICNINKMLEVQIVDLWKRLDETTVTNGRHTHKYENSTVTDGKSNNNKTGTAPSPLASSSMMSESGFIMMMSTNLSSNSNEIKNFNVF